MRKSDVWFDTIYAANFPRLTKTAYYILWDEYMAEDIVQNAFSILLIKRKRLFAHPNLSAWLVKTVRNMADNELKKAYHTREVPFLPEYEPAAREAEEEFMSLLPPGLSPRQQQSLYLYIEVGLNHDQIAAIQGCTPEASRMRLCRARKRCKELLLEKEDFFS